jgi:hypothetical protein
VKNRIKKTSTFSPIPLIMKTKATKHKIETAFGKYGYDLWRVNPKVHIGVSNPIHESIVSPWAVLIETLRYEND